MNFKTLNNIVGWLVFAIAFTVFYLSAEDTGSLWDCGEFITGAYKLQVVHPPGAPLFILIGRMFVLVGQLFSSKPETIAFSVNLMSGACTALAAMLICWTTVILGKIALVGRENDDLDGGQTIAVLAAGVAAGLTTAFTSSVWFSAVEGEVYAMSTFFTTLVIWAIVKWYNMPDNPQSDRWIIFAIYAAALSIGVHLLSLLTFPALSLFYYYKKYKDHTFRGMLLAAAAGVGLILAIQVLVVTGIPRLWSTLELMMVNSFGMPINSGIIPLALILVGIAFFGFRYAHKNENALVHKIMLGFVLSIIGFSTIGIVVLRANANTPINMNNPNNPFGLLMYLNREQYGERPLLKGPNYDAKPVDQVLTMRYGQVGDHYEKIYRKIDPVYNSADEILFPRMGDYQAERIRQYEAWMGGKKGNPTFGDNIGFFLRYQVGWMYWRYFMWNFVGRQNGEQGYFPWDKKDGHWISGITPWDEARLYNMKEMTPAMRKDQARNTYYGLPLLFGLLGVFWHLARRREEFTALLGLFIITGIGIIVYSNQPPSEPRERDYVLVGSFFTFCIWIGMGVLAIYSLLKERLNLAGTIAAVVAGVLVLSAPTIMLAQNFDDHSRHNHTGSRDYASNFLNSCDKNALIFTYGDNDTYPLWYAQEVEGIRPDVRVVNLSLIAVDWYIDQMRRKVNDSEPIKMSMPPSAYRGFKRDQVPIYSPTGQENVPMDLKEAIKYAGEDHPVSSGAGIDFESHLPTTELVLNVNNKAYWTAQGFNVQDSTFVPRINFSLGKRNSILKDDLSVLDIIASNFEERPIYFAVTCRPEKIMGLEDYMQLEGLALRLVPFRSKSDPQFSIYGFGRVNRDKVYENVVKKFKWGNFDKYEMYVDRSYLPSIQSHRLVMLRAAQDMIENGDNKRAVELIDKYFEGFPAMNFPYDYSAMYMINAYQAANAYEQSKKHIDILAQRIHDNLKFLYSLDKADLEGSFEQDFAIWNQTKDQLVASVKKAGDKEMEKKLADLFAPFPNMSEPEKEKQGN